MSTTIYTYVETQLSYYKFIAESVISTIIIPNIKDLQLEKSETFIYNNDRLPTFSIGPNGFNSPGKLLVKYKGVK